MKAVATSSSAHKRKVRQVGYGVVVALLLAAVVRYTNRSAASGASIASSRSDFDQHLEADGRTIAPPRREPVAPAEVAMDSPASPSPVDPGLPEEYRSFPTLGVLPPGQTVALRSMLRAFYKQRCAELDQALTRTTSQSIDADADRARMLHDVEVSLAAIDAFEKGCYVTIAADGPTPPLLPEVERIITGTAGLMQGKRANTVVVMPYDRYPALVATKKYKADVMAEQLRARILVFNQLPIAERRALRAKALDYANLAHEDLMRVHEAMPSGAAWDEASATLSDRAWRR